MPNKYNFPFTRPPSIKPRWGGGDSLGSKIETMFIRFIQSVIEWGSEFFAELAVDIFDASMKIMRPGLAKVTDPIIKEMLGNEALPPYIRTSLQGALTETGESSFLIKLAVFYTAVFGTLTGGLSPIRRLAEYNADKDVRSYLPSPQELATLHLVGLVSDTAFRDNMAKLGVAEPLIPVYKEFARNLPSMGELFNGLWRGLYSEGEFIAYLKRMGYNDKDAQAVKALTENLPPLTDLIHMLVRDAFNNSAASQYGYDEDFPQEINEFFEKQGYSADWAKRYWRSHWNLPSPTQGYEMLHRGLIEIGDLDTLLRISDYPKFWRDKLRDISYNLYTRVDVRRLLQAGMLSDNEAFEAYKEMGYNAEKARKLTDFAIQGISNDERDLTKTEILNLFEEGLIDESETVSNLVKMGYDSQEADAITQLSKVNIAKSMRTDLINYAKERFLAKQIDEGGARNELNQIGLKSQSVDRYLLNWQRATEIESAIPPLADVKKWYLQDYIDESKLRSFLAQLRHTNENIELYVLQLNDQKAQAINEQSA
jgi:hypothetical protein